MIEPSVAAARPAAVDLSLLVITALRRHSLKSYAHFTEQINCSLGATRHT